jgi:hypothetical protein
VHRRPRHRLGICTQESHVSFALALFFSADGTYSHKEGKKARERDLKVDAGKCKDKAPWNGSYEFF